MSANDKLCKHCQYCRDAGFMNVDIPGEGEWCSNSKSPRFMTRVKADDTCEKFLKRGEKAPLWMRLKIKAIRAIKKK